MSLLQSTCTCMCQTSESVQSRRRGLLMTSGSSKVSVCVWESAMCAEDQNLEGVERGRAGGWGGGGGENWGPNSLDLQRSQGSLGPNTCAIASRLRYETSQVCRPITWTPKQDTAAARMNVCLCETVNAADSLKRGVTLASETSHLCACIVCIECLSVSPWGSPSWGCCLSNPTVTFIIVIIMSLQLAGAGSPSLHRPRVFKSTIENSISWMKLFSDGVHHTQGLHGMFIELFMECNSQRGHRWYDDVGKVFYVFLWGEIWDLLFGP